VAKEPADECPILAYEASDAADRAIFPTVAWGATCGCDTRLCSAVLAFVGELSRMVARILIAGYARPNQRDRRLGKV